MTDKEGVLKQLREVKVAKEGLEEDADTLQRKLAAVERQKQLAQEAQQRAEQEIEQAMSTIETLQERLSDVNGQVKKLTKQMEAARKEAVELQDTQSEAAERHAAEVERLKEVNRAHAAEIQRLEEEADGWESRVNELTKQAQEAQAALAEAEAEAAEAAEKAERVAAADREEFAAKEAALKEEIEHLTTELGFGPMTEKDAVASLQQQLRGAVEKTHSLRRSLLAEQQAALKWQSHVEAITKELRDVTATCQEEAARAAAAEQRVQELSMELGLKQQQQWRPRRRSNGSTLGFEAPSLPSTAASIAAPALYTGPKPSCNRLCCHCPCNHLAGPCRLLQPLPP